MDIDECILTNLVIQVKDQLQAIDGIIIHWNVFNLHQSSNLKSYISPAICVKHLGEIVFLMFLRDKNIVFYSNHTYHEIDLSNPDFDVSEIVGLVKNFI